jgi:putative ABC transport system permease protein
VAIVDQGFVDLVLEGRNPIGQRLRFAPQEPQEGAPPEPWFEVVGLVKELGIAAPYQRGRQPGFYLPGPSDRLRSLYVMVHTPSSDPAAFGPKLREIATAVDPTLRLSEILPANQVNNDLVWVMGLWLRITSVVSAVALTLSLAGIYAVLAFTVSRRTREIGVRVALGGSRDRVLAAIFRRPLIRVGIGVFIGASLVLALGILTRGTEFPGSDAPIEFRHFVLLGGYVVLILGVCLLACIVPARRALGVQPTVALRSE